MPRHRTEQVPRHRTQRRIQDSARRVLVSAAISGAHTAPERSGPDDASAVTQPLPMPPPRQRRVAEAPPSKPRPASRPSTGRLGLLRGAARSSLVTPWFAACAGFVIAASLWIYAPHTMLRFPSSALNDTPCRPADCSAQSPGSTGGRLSELTPGTTITPAQSARDGRGTPEVTSNSPIASLKFDFNVIFRGDDSFTAVISVSGKSLPSSWRLSFSIPGVQINYVSGAYWLPTPSGTGGTASSSDPQLGSAGGDTTSHRRIQIILGGTGTANMPTGCTFDGYACTFR